MTDWTLPGADKERVQVLRLKNEDGSTTTFVLFILIGAIFLSFVFLDFFSTFANKRISQSGADAGALAAAREAKLAYEEELRIEILDELGNLEEEIDEELERRIEELLEQNEEVENEDEEAEEIEIDEDEIREEIISDWGIPDTIVERLDNLSAELEFEEAAAFFFHNDDVIITQIMCRGINNRWNDIDSAAKYYAEKNGAVNDAEDDIVVRFPYNDEFKIQVYTKRNPAYITVDSGNLENNNVYAQAASSVSLLDGFSFVVSACH
ncbi:pilus assembly protein TadG-related protein [Evansella sp. LMS18]|uniref:pilus assembly protein TadG-related protein n=1 Tax=Evansella sp. LMS18 TaxID=2924033 RepID=UPI0020D1D855|nr:pilus assembly protein TadG-related protein [Evansella sp. LMS18]UTR11087.1 pilus assembly protein TadG-related protein [Evansella sp. LMS18]